MPYFRISWYWCILSPQALFQVNIYIMSIITVFIYIAGSHVHRYCGFKDLSCHLFNFLALVTEEDSRLQRAICVFFACSLNQLTVSLESYNQLLLIARDPLLLKIFFFLPTKRSFWISRLKILSTFLLEGKIRKKAFQNYALHIIGIQSILIHQEIQSHILIQVVLEG